MSDTPDPILDELPPERLLDATISSQSSPASTVCTQWRRSSSISHTRTSTRTGRQSSLAFESEHARSVAMTRIPRSKPSCDFCAPAG